MIGILSRIWRQHWREIVLALLVGAITIAPVFIFRISLGSRFQGMHFLPLDDEEFYLTRMQEIVDGHPLIGSMFLWEYKNRPPLLPPTVEFIYVSISKILGVAPVAALIGGKFVWPAILFLLVFALVKQLTAGVKLSMWAAAAGGLLVTLGFDLVDYQRLVALILGAPGQTGGLPLWARPVNPVAGAVGLFSFLNLLWLIIERRRRRLIPVASLFLALMFGSYYFSWGMALAITAVLGLVYLFYRRFAIIKDIFFVVILGVILAAPYWYLVSWARSFPEFAAATTRFALLYTRQPLANNLVTVATLAFAGGLVIYQKWSARQPGEASGGQLTLNTQPWAYWGGAFLVGSLAAFNQQVITGRAVWPFHFVSYSIPLVYLAAVVMLARLGSLRWSKLASSLLAALGVAAVLFSVAMAARFYQVHYQTFVERQPWAELFTWFNQNTPRDSVVLVAPNAFPLDQFITAYTHNNVYLTEPGNVLAPAERFYHNYLTLLRLKEVPAAAMADYLEAHPAEVTSFLSNSIFALQPTKEFPVREEQLEEVKRQLPADYGNFLQQDFISALRQYRLNYLLSRGALSAPLARELGNPPLVKQVGELFVYQM
ncbi:MAG: hypothetical protein HYV42_01395 [Candidatus Magasanikbacteria bacterium]|nr:hypothetical protein [Candidatus Magasanikbacteria bacterium]